MSLLGFGKQRRDVTNDALIMWATHSEALEGCLTNDYRIQLKRSTDCARGSSEVSVHPKRVKSSNLALNFLFSSVLIPHLPPALSAPRRLESPQSPFDGGGEWRLKWSQVTKCDWVKRPWNGPHFLNLMGLGLFGFFCHRSVWKKVACLRKKVLLI